MTVACPDTGFTVHDCWCADCGDLKELWAMRRRRDEVRDPVMRQRLDHYIALYERALLEHDRLVTA